MGVRVKLPSTKLQPFAESFGWHLPAHASVAAPGHILRESRPGGPPRSCALLDANVSGPLQVELHDAPNPTDTPAR